MRGPIVQEGCVLPMDKHSGRVVLSVLIIEPADAADKRLRSKRIMGSDSVDGRRCGSRPPMTRITPLSDAIHSLDRELGPLDTVTAQEAVNRSGERFAKLVFKAPETRTVAAIASVRACCSSDNI